MKPREIYYDEIMVLRKDLLRKDSRNRFLRGLAVGIPIALLLWGLIVLVFSL